MLDGRGVEGRGGWKGRCLGRRRERSEGCGCSGCSCLLGGRRRWKRTCQKFLTNVVIFVSTF